MYLWSYNEVIVSVIEKNDKPYYIFHTQLGIFFQTKFYPGIYTLNYTLSPQEVCSFDQPQKDERLSQPWGHPVVLNQGPLNWE